MNSRWEIANPPAGSDEPAERKLVIVKNTDHYRLVEFKARELCKCEKEAGKLGKDVNDIDTCRDCPFQPREA